MATAAVSGGKVPSERTQVTRKGTSELPRKDGTGTDAAGSSHTPVQPGQPSRLAVRALTGPNRAEKAGLASAEQGIKGPAEGDDLTGWTTVTRKGSSGSPRKGRTGTGPAIATQGEGRQGKQGRLAERATPGPIRALANQANPNPDADTKKRRNRRFKRQSAAKGTPDVPVKRAREPSDETTARNDPKKVKTQGSYRDIAAAGLRMALILENYPEECLTAKEGESIQALLFDKLMEAPDPLPLINMGSIVSGALFVTCANEASAKWLQTHTGAKVGASKLKVVAAKDLPRPVKMAWKSRHTAATDMKRVLHLTQRLNPGLKTEEWRVIDTKVEATHVRRIVLVDKVSAEVIKAAGYKLPTGLDYSIFKVLDESTPKGDTQAEEAPEMDPPATETPTQVVTEDPTPGSSKMEVCAPASPVSTIGTEDLYREMTSMGLETDEEPNADGGLM